MLLEVLRPGDALEVGPGQRLWADRLRGSRRVPLQRGRVGAAVLAFEYRLFGKGWVALGERRHVEVRVLDRRPRLVGGREHLREPLLERLLLVVGGREDDPVPAHRDVGAHVVQRVPVRIEGGRLPAVLLWAAVSVAVSCRVASDDGAFHSEAAVGRTEVPVEPVVLEGVFEGRPRVGGGVAARERPVQFGHVVRPALAGPLPDDRGPRVDVDCGRVEGEGAAVALGADCDGHLALPARVDGRPVEVVRVGEPVAVVDVASRRRRCRGRRVRRRCRGICGRC